MKIAILSFTKKGKLLENLITENFNSDFLVYKKNDYETAKEWTAKNFNLVDAIVFIGAVGIATRFIAGSISSKDVDPAVIVIDELGNYVIPILSGHIGGGNELSNSLAKITGGTAVITTATDINGKLAIDVWSSKLGCVIDDISLIKKISSAVLNDVKVGFHSDFPLLSSLPKELELAESGETGVVVSFDPCKKLFKDNLNVIPKIIFLGVGCKKNTSTTEFEKFILNEMLNSKISIKSVKSIASIDLKENEKCILDFSAKYKIPFTTFSATELNSVEGVFTGSDFVKKITGTDNVCERSAILSSGGEIIKNKTSYNGMTLSIAKENWRCEF